MKCCVRCQDNDAMTVRMHTHARTHTRTHTHTYTQIDAHSSQRIMMPGRWPWSELGEAPLVAVAQIFVDNGCEN